MTKVREFVEYWAPKAKAVAGAAVAAYAAYLGASADDVMSATDWFTVASAFLGAFGVVYGIPNTAKKSHGG